MISVVRPERLPFQASLKRSTEALLFAASPLKLPVDIANDGSGNLLMDGVRGPLLHSADLAPYPETSLRSVFDLSPRRRGEVKLLYFAAR